MAYVLRGESLFKGELSDEFGIECQREDDPHQFYIAIAQRVGFDTDQLPVEPGRTVTADLLIERQ